MLVSIKQGVGSDTDAGVGADGWTPDVGDGAPGTTRPAQKMDISLYIHAIRNFLGIQVVPVFLEVDILPAECP